MIKFLKLISSRHFSSAVGGSVQVFVSRHGASTARLTMAARTESAFLRLPIFQLFLFFYLFAISVSFSFSVHRFSTGDFTNKQSCQFKLFSPCVSRKQIHSTRDLSRTCPPGCCFTRFPKKKKEEI